MLVGGLSCSLGNQRKDATGHNLAIPSYQECCFPNIKHFPLHCPKTITQIEEYYASASNIVHSTYKRRVEMYTVSKRIIAEWRHREDSHSSTGACGLRALISSGEVSVVIPMVESPASCGTLSKHIVKDKTTDPECIEQESQRCNRKLSEYRNHSATIIPILRITSTRIMRLLYNMDST